MERKTIEIPVWEFNSIIACDDYGYCYCDYNMKWSYEVGEKIIFVEGRSTMLCEVVTIGNHKTFREIYVKPISVIL